MILKEDEKELEEILMMAKETNRETGQEQQDSVEFSLKGKKCIAGGISSCYSFEMSTIIESTVHTIKDIHNEGYFKEEDIETLRKKLIGDFERLADSMYENKIIDKEDVPIVFSALAIAIHKLEQRFGVDGDSTDEQ